MRGDEPDPEAGLTAATDAVLAWCTARLPPADETGQLANAMEELIASDRSVVQVETVAEQHASVDLESRSSDRRRDKPDVDIIVTS
ncbi:MAG: hypothetical protein QM658_00985 [Gordonia sp. (in: high G+C Gram-positive bacteria)]